MSNVTVLTLTSRPPVAKHGLKIVLISLISACLIWNAVSSAAQASNDLGGIESNLTELREEVREIKALLLQISEKIEQKGKSSERKKSEGVTSQCTSLCESKAKSLLNETGERFKKHLDVCLNNATRKALNACDPDPCVNGGSCESILNGSDFRCNDCPIIWSGDKCQNLSCFQNETGKCFQRDDTVYFVHDMYATWEEAEERCAHHRMSLAEPKDRETSEYLAAELRKLYGKGFDFPGFWLGLRSPENGRNFAWEDGSALGEYTGGLDLNKIPSNYPCIYLHLRDQLREHLWDVSKCDSHQFPFCEKRISAR